MKCHWKKYGMKKLTKKEQKIVNEFVILLEKYKHLGPLKLAELLQITFDIAYSK